ncbi:hypothetical protein GJU40_01995 [Bacillus lacus]|uniref:Uncharacterized protein n=1 Tax=Metabacillus lacus TaxID=1983721 RepID=A0A7X2LYS4_9BACI|nr:hypothetical protein [Metabacillus lacus]MRX70939.1 hypothetical protein [Metabacillus lacus]
MLTNEDFLLISRALQSSYESLENSEESRPVRNILDEARTELFNAAAHAAALDRKYIVHTMLHR